MENLECFNLQQCQDEIEPVLNKILKEPEFIDVLQKHGVLEAAEIQLNLNKTKVRGQEVEARISNELKSNPELTQQIQAQGYVWCENCRRFLPRGKCPKSPNDCPP